MGIPTVSFLICLLGFLREKTTDLPGLYRISPGKLHNKTPFFDLLCKMDNKSLTKFVRGHYSEAQ